MAKHEKKEEKIEQSFANENANALHAKKQRKKHKKGFLVVIFILSVVGIAVAVYLVVFKPGAQPTPDPYDPFKDQLTKLEQGPVPTDPLDQAIYYSQLAQNLNGMQKFDDALSYYFKAQDIIDKNNLRGQLMFYLPVIDVYIAKKDNAKAREFIDRAIDFYSNEYIKLHPDDKATADDTINALKKQRDSL